MIEKNKKCTTETHHQRVDYTIHVLTHAVLYKSMLTFLSARGVAQWHRSSFSASSLSHSLFPIYCLSPMLFISLLHSLSSPMLFISLPGTIFLSLPHAIYLSSIHYLFPMLFIFPPCYLSLSPNHYLSPCYYLSPIHYLSPLLSLLFPLPISLRFSTL